MIHLLDAEYREPCRGDDAPIPAGPVTCGNASDGGWCSSLTDRPTLAEFRGPHIGAHPNEARALIQSAGALQVRVQAAAAEWGNPEAWPFYRRVRGRSMQPLAPAMILVGAAGRPCVGETADSGTTREQS